MAITIEFYKARVPDNYIYPDEKLESDIRRELLEYHYKHGHDGFGSERTDLNMIERKVENEMERNREYNKILFLIKSARISTLDDRIKIEQESDFIEWIDHKPIIANRVK